MKERLYLNTAKRLIEDLMDLQVRIENESFEIQRINLSYKTLQPCQEQKLQIHMNMYDIYSKLNTEICKQLKFMVESEINYLQCLDHDKPKDTNTNTDSKHNGALESSSQEKQPTIQCCRSKY